MAKALRVDRTPAAPAPHHGWLGGRTAGTKVSAWKDFETCPPEADWAEDVGDAVAADGTVRLSRRKVVKIECMHRGRSGKGRALVRGTDEFLADVYAVALINPCRYTECSHWKSTHPNESR